MSDLRSSYLYLGQLQEAMHLDEQTLELRKRFGKEHPDTLESMSNLASCYIHRGEHQEAMNLYEQTLSILILWNL